MRLIGGWTPNEGYVEALGSDGRWGGECDECEGGYCEVEGYGTENANVI